jgi:hypothetical protein
VAKLTRLDLRSVSAVIHTTPDVRPELLLGPGDDASRASYFDTKATRHEGGPRVIAHRARLTDYLDERGRRTNRRTLTIPPSTATRIAAACGDDDADGTGSRLNASLIGLAEWALAEIERQGITLTLKAPEDPQRAERLIARRRVSGRRV